MKSVKVQRFHGSWIIFIFFATGDVCIATQRRVITIIIEYWVKFGLGRHAFSAPTLFQHTFMHSSAFRKRSDMTGLNKWYEWSAKIIKKWNEPSVNRH